MASSNRNDEREAPVDFATYLAQDLSVTREAAFEVLGDWLAHYKPIKRRSIAILGVDSAPVSSAA